MPTTEQRASLRGSREVQFKPEADEDVLEGSPVEAPPSPTAFLEFNERVETQLIADKVRKVVRDLLEDMAKQGDGADENTELLLQDFDKKQLTETIRTPASGLGKLSGNVYGFLVHAVCSVGDGATTGVDCTEGSGWRAEKMTAAPVGQLNVASICRGTRRAHWVGALGDALKGAADEIGRLDSSTSEKELQQTIEQIEHVFEASFFGEKQENWCESAIARCQGSRSGESIAGYKSPEQ
ncbi:unnamed protein product [Amoebophrya sp. A25]|nr:unnamed protein product [Amoebophrya sp. A25]|eukprot:GSA25T00019031001.1